jgi:hypothetical protein
VQVGTIGEDITGQNPIPVAGVQHLAVGAAPTGPSAPPAQGVDLSGVLRRLDAILEDLGVPPGDSLFQQRERTFADDRAWRRNVDAKLDNHDQKTSGGRTRWCPPSAIGGCSSPAASWAPISRPSNSNDRRRRRTALSAERDLRAHHRSEDVALRLARGSRDQLVRIGRQPRRAGGVGRYPYRAADLAYVLRPRLPFDLSAAMAWFESVNGQPYGWLDLLAFVGWGGDAKGVVCSPFATQFLGRRTADLQRRAAQQNRPVSVSPVGAADRRRVNRNRGARLKSATAMEGLGREPRVHGRSRIHRPSTVLKELYRLRLKARRAMEFRAVSDDERRWCLDLDAALERAIIAGEQVLLGYQTRADRLTVRKRPGACSSALQFLGRQPDLQRGSGFYTRCSPTDPRAAI